MTRTLSTRRAPLGRRLGHFLGIAALCQCLSIATASATEGEEYPSPHDAGVETQVDSWRGAWMAAPIITTCGPYAWATGGERWRNPRSSLPLQGPWHHLSTFRGASTEITADDIGLYSQRGGDTDLIGNDVYVMFRVVARRASAFIKVVIEAEDRESAEWRLSFHGWEDGFVEASDIQGAQVVTIENPAQIEWQRRIVDFDAKGGTFDSEKRVSQDFLVNCQLIDGSQVHDGRTFEMTRPKSVTTGFSVGLTAGVKIGSQQGGRFVEPSAALNLGWSTQETYGTFVELTASEDHGNTSASATYNGTAPCPSSTRVTCQTWIDVGCGVTSGELDDGARAELTLSVLNYIQSILVAECYACDQPPPTPPPPTPTPTPRQPVPPPELPPPPRPPQYTPSEFDGRGNEKRDLDGDGKREGGVGGQVQEDPTTWAGCSPYFLGIGHCSSVPEEGYESVERWSIGDEDDRITGALFDPWNELDGRKALVAVKDTATGECILAEIDRGAVTREGSETWPDRSTPVPVTGYATTQVRSASLTSLLPGAYVAGAKVYETTAEGSRVVYVVPIVARQVTDEDDVERTILVPAGHYRVERDPVAETWALVPVAE